MLSEMPLLVTSDLEKSTARLTLSLLMPGDQAYFPVHFAGITVIFVPHCISEEEGSELFGVVQESHFPTSRGLVLPPTSYLNDSNRYPPIRPGGSLEVPAFDATGQKYGRLLLQQIPIWELN